MPNPVVHFEITGKDGKKAQEFYSKLFDWKIDTQSMGDYGLVSPAGDKSIGGGVFQTPEGAPPYITIYIQVEDLQAYLDKAENLGGKTIVVPTPIPNVGSFAMFADPDGNVIGLFKN